MVLHIHKQATQVLYLQPSAWLPRCFSPYWRGCPRTWQQILELIISKSYSAPGSRCHSAREVGVHGRNVLVEGGVLGVPGAGQPELLGGVGELEGGVRVGRVREQGALPLQQVPHPLQKLPESEGQGGLPQAVQLLGDRRNTSLTTKTRENLLDRQGGFKERSPYRRSGSSLEASGRSSESSARQSVEEDACDMWVTCLRNSQYNPFIQGNSYLLKEHPCKNAHV